MEVRQEVINVHDSKVAMYGDILADILKCSINIHLDFLCAKNEVFH